MTMLITTVLACVLMPCAMLSVSINNSRLQRRPFVAIPDMKVSGADVKPASSCCEEIEDDHYVCEDGCREFPDFFFSTPTNVSVTGGDFDVIPWWSFPSYGKIITLRNFRVGSIDEEAFDDTLDRVFTILFDGITIGRIKSKAFDRVHFRPTNEFPTGGEDDQSIKFINCKILSLHNNAFYGITGLKKLTFENTFIGSTERAERTFNQVEMEGGLVELKHVTVNNKQGFPHLDRIKNVSEVYIEDLHQYALSNDLVDPEVHTHTLKSSTFNITQENLSNQNYDDVILSWSDVTVHCGDDIDWLMKDKDSIPDEMLNSLVCNGPERLAGEHVADLSEEEWEDEDTPGNEEPDYPGDEEPDSPGDIIQDSGNSQTGVAVILIIVVGIIVAIGLLVLIVTLFRNRMKYPESALTVVMTDAKKRPQVELPPPYIISSSAGQDERFDNTNTYGNETDIKEDLSGKHNSTATVTSDNYGYVSESSSNAYNL